MAPPSPPVASLPLVVGEPPETLGVARLGITAMLRYHLPWDAHQPGVTSSVYLSGNAILMPPGAAVVAMLPPLPTSIPAGPSVVSAPSTRSWRPLGSGTPLRFGW